MEMTLTRTRDDIIMGSTGEHGHTLNIYKHNSLLKKQSDIVSSSKSLTKYLDNNSTKNKKSTLRQKALNKDLELMKRSSSIQKAKKELKKRDAMHDSLEYL